MEDERHLGFKIEGIIYSRTKFSHVINDYRNGKTNTAEKFYKLI